jgi:hypothetical protein
MFRNWLNGTDKKINGQNRVGVRALVWVIWNCPNGVVFNRMAKPNFLLVNTELMNIGCNRLMVVIHAIFSQGFC